MTLQDLIVVLPTVLLSVWAVVLLVVDLWIPAGRKGMTALLAAIGAAASLGVNLMLIGMDYPDTGFGGMAVLDGFSIFANILILGSALLGIAVAYDYNRRTGIERGEYYVLLLLSSAGMMLIVQAYNLIVVFLALELLSIPLYILSGFARPQPKSEESALKYFLLGAFASAFFLYGAALVYGGSQHLDFPGILAAFQGAGGPSLALMVVGAGLILVSLGFKVSAVPFHMWTPDVYHGAPSPVTAWMSVAVKVAGIGVLLRVFIVAFPTIAADMQPVLWGVAALTMVVGNLLAVVQSNIKRLLAYSSIAHVGYLLMAFVPYGNGEVVGSAVTASLFYLLAYGLTSFAAWGVVIAAEQSEGRGLELEDYAGLGRKYPWLGVAMMVAMFSFAGIPLTLGFWGKFYVFQVAIQGGAVGLAVIGILASLLSAYYYLRVLVMMYMRPGEPAARRESWLGLVTIGSAVAVVLLALIPGSIIDLASQALLRLP
ncbi:MAG: NADH-quinone oxidoreductase subunit N [Chloroflexi bacterium]|nr:NADH-quinone oxidoreductase subunit N [Chloroflexota bacterium]